MGKKTLTWSIQTKIKSQRSTCKIENYRLNEPVMCPTPTCTYFPDFCVFVFLSWFCFPRLCCAGTYVGLADLRARHLLVASRCPTSRPHLTFAFKERCDLLTHFCLYFFNFLTFFTETLFIPKH